MHITLPEYCLVVLIGASGAGKSTFAAKHFAATEVLSSDACRAWVSDDANDQTVTADAFDVLHYIASKRLAARRLTVVDATNVRPEDRRHFVRLAREKHAFAIAIVLDLPTEVCEQRNAQRPDRSFGGHVVRGHVRALRRSIRHLRREGFRYQFQLKTEEDVNAASIERTRLWTDKRDEQGPFDIIGDVHGCFDELEELLGRLGYQVQRSPGTDGDHFQVSHPQGRRLVLLGDLVDRGPNVPDCLRLAMDATAEGAALCVPGNHENKLLRKLRGRRVQVNHGLAETLAQLEAEPPALAKRVATFIDGLTSHYVLDEGKLVVAHAGITEALQNRSSGAVRSFCLYGETSGETDEFGLPIRYNWAADYRGDAHVVYGHTPVPRAEWLNRTICIDTGCVFGGSLTALRYPEKELVSVPARRVYVEPARPLGASPSEGRSAQQQEDDVLDIDDVRGKRFIATRLRGSITVREHQASAALEVISRFAVNPQWLIYLPPTMAPSDSSKRAGLLEHPDEAFAYFRGNDVQSVVCEEKHMGSRVVAIVCRDADAALRRFGATPDDGAGCLYTRTGRRVFDDEREHRLLDRIRAAATERGFWQRFETDWLCLDCELMPWSAKAKELLDQQYKPLAAASRMGLGEAVAALQTASARGVAVGDLLERFRVRATMADAYATALSHYDAPLASFEDLRLAPFHLLATETAAHTDKTHAWHMETLADLCAGTDELLMPTPHRMVDLHDDASCADAVAWWEQLTAAGGEGMVVKPHDFIARNGNRLLQPAVKCRGREYLRIIYGPEYSAEENLARLRSRGVAAKRTLALQEFALGVEGLQRFVDGEPLRAVHECAFAVLAMESAPVDPRL